MQLFVGSVCDRGLSPKRPVNEDRALALPERGLFVVCDGVGGHSSGEVASQLAVDTIEEAIEQLDGGDPRQILEQALKYANRDIYEMASNNPEYEGMGTTVALVFLDQRTNRAVIGHAGDSRVYRFDGTLHRETYDHTDLDDAIRAGQITPEQANALGKQNTINRALGIEHDVQAEFKTIPLDEGDAFLLTSDGVTRHIDDDELEQLLSEGRDPAALCEEIRSRCYARGAEDNLTAVVVYTRQPVPATTRAPAALANPSAPRRIDIDAPTERASRHGERRSGAAGGLFLLAVIAVGVLAFFAGRYLPQLLAEPAPPVPPATSAKEAFERGDLSVARAAFTRLASEEPRRADYQYYLGRIALETGETSEAIARLEEAVRLDAELPDAHLFLAAAYDRENRAPEALQSLRRFNESVSATQQAAQPPANAP